MITDFTCKYYSGSIPNILDLFLVLWINIFINKYSGPFILLYYLSEHSFSSRHYLLFRFRGRCFKCFYFIRNIFWEFTIKTFHSAFVKNLHFCKGKDVLNACPYLNIQNFLILYWDQNSFSVCLTKV